jgi:hypothetical protein
MYWIISRLLSQTPPSVDSANIAVLTPGMLIGPHSTKEQQAVFIDQISDDPSSKALFIGL